jgi:peptide deformylase
LALLEIVKVPDPVLSKRAEELRDFNPEVERVVRNMAETMYHAPGVGLAANQDKNLIVLVNPRIVFMEGEDQAEEGCLSVPELRVEIPRATRIKVVAKDLRGEDVELDAEGLLARAIQHELDHLEGTTILDKVGRLKRRSYLNNLKKQEKAGA